MRVLEKFLIWFCAIVIILGVPLAMESAIEGIIVSAALIIAFIYFKNKHL